jgi:mannose-6-phosphate isomerase-like protein (cupin superfamily)
LRSPWPLSRVPCLNQQGSLPVADRVRFEGATATLPPTDVTARLSSVIALDDLAHSEHSHDFVGSEDGEVPFSIILVHSAPGVGPKLHRHPYAEVFVVESGQATFQLGDETVVVESGHIVGPPDVPHGFTNTGSGVLRLTAIHGAADFNTEWLAGPDEVWTSKTRR